MGIINDSKNEARPGCHLRRGDMGEGTSECDERNEGTKGEALEGGMVELACGSRRR